MTQAKQADRRRNARIDADMRSAASQLWKAGKSAAEIGAALGLGRNTVVGMAFRDRHNFPPKGKGLGYARTSEYGSIVEWTDAMIAKASGLWNSGMAISAIAASLGASVAAISGIARRKREHFPARKTVRLAAKIKVNATRASGSGREFPPEPVVSHSVFDASRMQHAKPLMDLEACECRWALTDRGSHMFCAEVTEPGKSWCSHHARRVYGEGTKSERNAVRDARYVGKVAA